MGRRFPRIAAATATAMAAAFIVFIVLGRDTMSSIVLDGEPLYKHRPLDIIEIATRHGRYRSISGKRAMPPATAKYWRASPARTSARAPS